MYYADRLLPDETFRQNTLQIFSVKVARTTGALKWPLDVFGMIAVCDDLDHNRNIIFNRTRDNCQTLIEQLTLIFFPR